MLPPNCSILDAIIIDVNFQKSSGLFTASFKGYQISEVDIRDKTSPASNTIKSSSSSCPFPTLCGVSTTRLLLPFYPISCQLAIYLFHKRIFCHAIDPSLLWYSSTFSSWHIQIHRSFSNIIFKHTCSDYAKLLLLIVSVTSAKFKLSLI